MGSCDANETLEVKNILRTIITAGVFPSSNIEVVGGYKVVEKTRRDLNIALINEISPEAYYMGELDCELP